VTFALPDAGNKPKKNEDIDQRRDLIQTTTCTSKFGGRLSRGKAAIILGEPNNAWGETSRCKQEVHEINGNGVDKEIQKKLESRRTKKRKRLQKCQQRYGKSPGKIMHEKGDRGVGGTH